MVPLSEGIERTQSVIPDILDIRSAGSGYEEGVLPRDPSDDVPITGYPGLGGCDWLLPANPVAFESRRIRPVVRLRRSDCSGPGIARRHRGAGSVMHIPTAPR